MDNRIGNICMCRRCDGIVHTIRRGDTLYLLSRQYNVSVNDIMNANRNVNIYNLRIGDQLCIPVRRASNNNPTINDIREEIIEEIFENVNVSSNETEEAVPVMQNAVYEENYSEKKVADLLNNDLTVKELAKMLKEIDK